MQRRPEKLVLPESITEHAVYMDLSTARHNLVRISDRASKRMAETSAMMQHLSTLRAEMDRLNSGNPQPTRLDLAAWTSAMHHLSDDLIALQAQIAEAQTEVEEVRETYLYLADRVVQPPHRRVLEDEVGDVLECVEGLPWSASEEWKGRLAGLKRNHVRLARVLRFLKEEQASM